jgi:hypothetical protein
LTNTRGKRAARAAFGPFVRVRPANQEKIRRILYVSKNNRFADIMLGVAINLSGVALAQAPSAAPCSTVSPAGNWNFNGTSTTGTLKISVDSARNASGPQYLACGVSAASSPLVYVQSYTGYLFSHTQARTP